MNIKFIVCLPALVWMLASCSPEPKRIYDTYRVVPNEEWGVDTAYKFVFEVKDSSERYDISLNLRNTLSYPYYNLFVDYSLADITGKVLKTDRPELQLMDSKTGKPFGNTIGGYYDHNFLLMGGYTFPKTGKYVITLKQYMRETALKEIAAVGIKVQESAKK